MVAGGEGVAVLLPVKSPGTGKTRIAALSDLDRASLAAAFATDVVDACLRTPGVAACLVVSDDAAFAATLAARGALVCDDPGTGLNGALRHAADVARVDLPTARPVALCADLPSLRSEDLAVAVHVLAGGGTWFVRDADGTGTTLYSAPYDAFDPRFGPGSAQAHADAGARPVPGTLATLRRDVDDVESLREAIALGTGPATRSVLTHVSI